MGKASRRKAALKATEWVAAVEYGDGTVEARGFASRVAAEQCLGVYAAASSSQLPGAVRRYWLADAAGVVVDWGPR